MTCRKDRNYSTGNSLLALLNGEIPTIVTKNPLLFLTSTEVIRFQSWDDYVSASYFHGAQKEYILFNTEANIWFADVRTHIIELRNYTTHTICYPHAYQTN